MLGFFLRPLVSGSHPFAVLVGSTVDTCYISLQRTPALNMAPLQSAAAGSRSVRHDAERHQCRRFHFERSPQCVISRRCRSRFESDASGRGVESRTSQVSAEASSWCVTCVRAGFHSACVSARHPRRFGGRWCTASMDMSVDDSDQERPARLTGHSGAQ